MVQIWEVHVPNDEKKMFCGIAGKCQANGNVLGKMFPYDGYVSSYVDFHFGQSTTSHYGDCCEFIRTDILKQYRFPEHKETKFVPEYYVFDQIGCDYRLYCTNDVIKVVEYMEDGITKNPSYYTKNAIGVLYGCVIRIDVVFNKTKVGLKQKFGVWLEYWTLRDITKLIPSAPKVAHMSILGAIAKFYYCLHKVKEFILK